MGDLSAEMAYSCRGCAGARRANAEWGIRPPIEAVTADLRSALP